jgi:hypothetical protein
MGEHICKIDGEKFNTLEELHKHLRKIRTLQKDYYYTYYKRVDLFTGELIPYKDYSSYFSSYFATRSNMVEWLKKTPKEESLPVVREMFAARKKLKELVFIPTEIELRTSILPSTPFFEKMGVDYTIFCEELGYKRRFVEPKELRKGFISKDLVIAVDTREKTPLALGCKTISKKIDEGDYGVEGSLFCNLFIERKSLVDLVGTLSSGYERFLRELNRAKEKKKYIVILVEENIDLAINFGELPYMKYCQATPVFIFSRLKGLLQQFSNIQILFVNNRAESARVLPKIFAMKEQAKELDLQQLYKKGQL